ncbi:MAG TPA: hypothetical protein VNH84_22125 [Candidatus Saccharimonadales bacterium]|nr:hypothetical protein [Candidatus Saccharimonadales bacterium]
MKKAGVWAGLLAIGVLVALVAGCLDSGGGSPSAYKGPLLRYHFAGRAHLPTGTNAVIYRTIDGLPITAELRGDIAQKLAAGALPFWKKDLPAGVGDASAIFRPLLDDFQVAEGYLEIRGPLRRTESVLAVELSDARAQIWNTKLRELTTAWKLGTPRDVTVEGVKGWEVKRAQAPNTLQFFRTDKWVLIGLSQDANGQLPALLKQTRETGRPLPALSGHFLEFSVDLPRLKPLSPLLTKFPLPAIEGTVAPRGADVRTEARLYFSTRLPRTESWRIPSQAISEPLTSFTAAQGVGPLLSVIAGGMDVGVKPLPNQYCAWGINHPQCRIFFGVPVIGNSTNIMKDVASQLPRFILATVTNVRGDFFYVSNRSELAWIDLQYMIPVVHADRMGLDDYLVGGTFPLSDKRTPPPDKLFEQVRGRTNLFYYDWEITQARLVHGKQFYQLLCGATGRHVPSTNTAVQRWIAAVGPKLTNTVTEITQAGPQELSLVRRSPIGFTGFELATLATFLDSPAFPFRIELPPIFPWTVTNSTAYRLAHSQVKGNAIPPAPRHPAGGSTNAPALKR